MAAIETTKQTTEDTAFAMAHLGSALMKAAMGLPLALPLAFPLALGVNTMALADSAPDKGLVSLKYLDYLDSQPGFDRIRVRAPSVLVMKPLSSEWSVSSTDSSDSVSGGQMAREPSGGGGNL